MKNVKIIFGVAVMAAIALTSCDGKEKVAVEGVSLNTTFLTLGVGDTETLIAEVLPEQAANKDVTWKSDNEAVATVIDGVVTAKAEGTANITATAKNGGKTEVCIVKVSRLGRVTFRTPTQWVVGTQTWTDVVMAVRCNKDDFVGGGYTSEGEYVLREDCCRNNVEEFGHLFSWAAVSEYKDVLCPKGWRVPTMDDFITLDKSLGGTGSYAYNTPLYEEYIKSWGGELTGYIYAMGTFYGTKYIVGRYWSATPIQGSTTHAYALGFSYTDVDGGWTNPWYENNGANGMTVRCVKSE